MEVGWVQETWGPPSRPPHWVSHCWVPSGGLGRRTCGRDLESCGGLWLGSGAGSGGGIGSGRGTDEVSGSGDERSVAPGVGLVSGHVGGGCPECCLYCETNVSCLVSGGGYGGAAHWSEAGYPCLSSWAT